MRTITFSVADQEEITQRVLAAVAGKGRGRHYMSFASVELMWQTLTQKRWQIIQLMTGQEAMSLREIARRAERDVKAVHGDVHALIAAGVIDRTADGKFAFPYDAVRVEFTLRKVA